MSKPIILDPANTPPQPGEPPRKYGPPLKDPATGKSFWGCDQQKTLGTIRLNVDRLDKYEMRLRGSRATFCLDGHPFWTTTTGIHDFVDQIIRKEIALINNKTNHAPHIEGHKNTTDVGILSDKTILRDCVRKVCMGEKTVKSEEVKAKVRNCYKIVTGNSIPDTIDPFDYT